MGAIRNYKGWLNLFEQDGNAPFDADFEEESFFAPSSVSIEDVEGGYGKISDLASEPGAWSEIYQKVPVPGEDEDSEETVTPKIDLLSGFKRLLANPTAKESLKKRLNQVIYKEITSGYRPTETRIDLQAKLKATGNSYMSLMAPTFGDDIKIKPYLSSIKVTDIIPNPENELIGSMTASIQLGLGAKNSEILKLERNGLAMAVSAKLYLSYRLSESQISEKGVIMTWRIKSVQVNGSAKIKSGPFVNSPISVSIVNGKMSVVWNYDANTNLSLISNQDLQINNFIPEKSGSEDIAQYIPA